jgi:hypothetical protein
VQVFGEYPGDNVVGLQVLGGWLVGPLIGTTGEAGRQKYADRVA